jgi:hypothetical protein
VEWPWRDSPWEPRVRDARLRAHSPTDGPVTLGMVDDPGQDRLYLMGLTTALRAPPLIRRWRRRRWIEPGLRTLKHLRAPEACQGQSEDAYDGPLVRRRLGCFIVFYTTRVICTGALTREEIGFRLTHDWRVVDSDALE